MCHCQHLQEPFLCIQERSQKNCDSLYCPLYIVVCVLLPLLDGLGQVGRVRLQRVQGLDRGVVAVQATGLGRRIVIV